MYGLYGRIAVEIAVHCREIVKIERYSDIAVGKPFRFNAIVRRRCSCIIYREIAEIFAIGIQKTKTCGLIVCGKLIIEGNPVVSLCSLGCIYIGGLARIIFRTAVGEIIRGISGGAGNRDFRR